MEHSLFLLLPDVPTTSGIGMEFFKAAIVIIVGGFMPLTVRSYFLYFRPKKIADFTKAKDQMVLPTDKTLDTVLPKGQYFLPVAFATVICVFVSTVMVNSDYYSAHFHDFVLFTGANFGNGAANRAIALQSVSVLTFAFLGGFLWSAMTIIRRLVVNDLQPSLYYTAGIRIFLACIVSVAAMFILGNDSGPNNLMIKSMPMVSFLIGAFPERMLDFFINRFRNWFNPSKVNDWLTLDNIEGMTEQHRQRLEEIQVDSAQTLAQMSVSTLLLLTPYDGRVLLDWIGQSKLLCYAKENIAGFRKVGIRTVYDLRAVLEQGVPEDKANYLQKIATSSGLSSILIENIIREMDYDDGIKNLHSYQVNLNTTAGAPTTKTVNDPNTQANAGSGAAQSGGSQPANGTTATSANGNNAQASTTGAGTKVVAIPTSGPANSQPQTGASPIDTTTTGGSTSVANNNQGAGAIYTPPPTISVDPTDANPMDANGLVTPWGVVHEDPALTNPLTPS
jgi:hypothetical protein